MVNDLSTPQTSTLIKIECSHEEHLIKASSRIIINKKYLLKFLIYEKSDAIIMLS